MKALYLFLTTNVIAINIAFSQGTAINTTGAAADSSAMLDISSNNKGILLPRMTTSERNSIASPAQGLLVFNITTECFEAYNTTSAQWASFGCIGCQQPGSFTAGSASNITSASFYANWSAASGASTYYLDVSTASNFSVFVTGYNNLNVGNVITYSVTGLTCNTTYYYRLRANNSCGTTGNSNPVTVTTSACCSNAWNQKLDFGGSARYGAVGFSIGTKAYIGTGYQAASPYYTNDFWEYDQASNSWTQKANFIGAARGYAAGFAIGTKGYLGTGSTAGGYVQDFYEYNPATNSWTPRLDVPGGIRGNAVGFSIGTKGYIGTGRGSSTINKDFWEYDPTNNTWSQKADFGGTARYYATGYSSGTGTGYIGTGITCFSTSCVTSDFWEYNQTSNTWSQKADFGGGLRCNAVSFAIGANGYMGTGQDASNPKNDFWMYNPTNNTWTQKTNFLGNARRMAVGFSIGNFGYIGTGFNPEFKDFWEYCP